MEDSLYRVVAAGHPVDGAQPETVRGRLSSQLKLSPQRAGLLLAGKPVVVKRAIDRDTALQYCARLQALGLAARIEAETPPAAPRFVFAAATRPAKTPRYWLALARCGGHHLAIVAGYFALVAAAIGALLWYAFAFAHLLRQPPLWWYGPLYLLPLCAGALALPLLLRPLWISPPAAPALPAAPAACHEFAVALCAAFGCPAPTAFELDAGIALTAAPVAGRRGLWPGDYRLTLGVPLLQSLTQAQLAGLFAAALSPLAHPLTRVCLRLNRAIAERCAACARGEDRLALALAAAAARWRQPIAATALRFAARSLQRSSRWLGRGAGWAAAALGHAAPALQEDADRWQLAAAGPAAFTATLIARHKLAAAQADALRHNREHGAGAGAGLADNLPALVQHYADHLDAGFERELRRRWESGFTRADSAAAVERERIARAEAQPGEALAADATPASALLGELETWQRAVTLALYRDPPWQAAEAPLQPVAALLFTASEELARRRLAEDYFNGWFRRDRFWALPDHNLIKTMPVADAAAQLHVCVNEIRRLTPDRLRQLAAAGRLSQEIDELQLGQQVQAAGQPFVFRGGDRAFPASALAQAQQQLADATAQLSTQEAIMGGRVALALRLAGLAASDGEDLHHCLQFLHGEQDRLDRLGAQIRLRDQLRRRPAGEGGYRQVLARLDQKLDDAATRLVEKLKNVPNPLDTPHLSMGEYVSAQLTGQPAGERAARLLESLYQAHEKLSLLIADHGSAAEAAYKTERIRLVDPERY